QEQFSLLGRHVRAMLKTTAELMAAGHYYPTPTQFGQSTACRTCDYRAVCGLDVQKHPGQVREVPNRNAKEFFEEAGKEAL
ncbi:MAG: PD-(D/E)XK nuclease family protein, partial [Oscillospiraceae bacterium]|nr:PD-(D/E)XK nuclease family protein [Oscillospiraceae bacterium]